MSSYIGLFRKAAEAKSTTGGDYGKPGHYFVVIEGCKAGTQSLDGKEYLAVECRVLHVIDKMIFPGDPKQVPLGKGGQALLNVPGSEPKPGDTLSFVFKDGVIGNENRMKALVLKAVDMTDDDWKRAFANPDDGEKQMKMIADPSSQPLKNVVLEVKAGEQTTRKGDKIVGSKVIRRVWAEELRLMWTENKLAQGSIDVLNHEKRLEKMLAQEAAEKAHKAATAGAAK